MKLHPTHRKRNRGLSMVEMLMSIAIIGVLSGIAVTSASGILGNSKDVVADNVLDTLNKATRKFSHSQWDLAFNPVAASAGDELYVLRTLQWKDSDTSELNPPGPFMRGDWNPVSSSSNEDHRLQWSGTAWKVLRPGTAGVGLKVQFDGSDLGTTYIHPDDFTPVGSK